MVAKTTPKQYIFLFPYIEITTSYGDCSIQMTVIFVCNANGSQFCVKTLHIIIPHVETELYKCWAKF